MRQIISALRWLVAHRNTLFNALLWAAVAFLLSRGITLYNENKKLSESLETAQNNIEAYQGYLQDSQQANNVLRLTVEELQNNKDKLVQRIDSIRKQLKLKPKQISTAATEKQILYVNDSKGVGGQLTEILKDTVYTDSIKYNDLTTVHYTIGNDTVSIGLDIQNTQYLFVYNTKEYKRKKNLLLRILTLDFKKVKKYHYTIHNTNDLLKTSDVRVLELKD